MSISQHTLRDAALAPRRGRRFVSTPPVVVALYALFFVTGTATVMYGALLPLLPGNARLTEALVARALAVQFTGQLVGPLIPWRRPMRGLAVGSLLIAGACALLCGGGPRAFVPALLVYGLGLGIAMTLTNVIVAAEGAPEDRTSRLEMLNVFWPLGAAFCPWWLEHSGAGRHPAMPAVCVGVAFAVAGVAAWMARGANDPATAQARDAEGQTATTASRLLLLSLLALLAVGVESGVANWMPAFAHRYLAGRTFALPLATVFWLGILAGRVGAATLFRRSVSRRVVPVLLLIAAVAIIVLASAQDALLFYLGAGVAALAIAPVYPVLLSAAVGVRWQGIVFASAGVGSALLPWIVGQTALRTDSLQRGLMVLSGAAVLLAVGVAAYRKREVR